MTTYIKIIFIISIVFNFSYSDTLENIQELSIKEDAKSQYELGKIYRKNGEYIKAFEYFQKSANQGYDKAEFILGYMYSHGEGIEKDYQKAIQWYEKSANQNNSNAQFNLATMYSHGEGIEKDYQKAIEWYEKSANQNNSNAQSNLGNMYRDAEGVAKDIQKAIQWYEKSANQGNPYAYYNLGAMYLNGKEVKKDYKKAVELLKKSLNQKDKLPQEYIDKLCKIVPEVCTSTNIEQKPSFDCKNIKKDSVESLICKSNNLSKLDVELNEIYKKLLQIIPEKKELIQEQREFLKDRETCTNEDCIKNIYQDRLYILNSIYKFINVNLDDYKSQKIKYVDIGDFIYLNEIKNKLFVNKLLNILDIFEKNNYILFEDGFLIRFYDVRISNGIYYANTKTGKIKKIADGEIKDNWFIVKNSNPIKVVFKSGDGVHGVGYESIESTTIQDGENIENKVILETQYDMESGFCNRAEILGIRKSGDIKNFEYDETKNLLKIDFIEQDCSTNKYKEKILLYDLVKDKFDNDKTIEQELFYDDKKDILIDKQGNIKDKF
ncbi:tetratricopeptide repeat-containing protein [Aliarcobacter butzleri]|uniref:tetratricopeptide repeat-containing protein n=1 Tax=Aliarcobacter butzleri TaxID=28197 RepID=UPI001EDA18CD|nr:tetratricopeptide repeat-containing protein [Aliarcobacter butzleri]MCG3659941.1 lysozyme inhibitor LprI family protein [Aliarcobacter butzleri]